MREPILNIAVEAARAGSVLIMRAMKRMDMVKVSEKSPNDFVTEVDQRVEEEIISVIKKAYPQHSILGEESGELDGNEYQWIIDPIDGTRNFIHGFPHFAISIAVMHKNRLEYGVIYDPLRQELFTATLDLAYVACGRLDGYWEKGLHIWDIAAGILLVKEAGGMICDTNGGENYLKSGDVVAANMNLVKQMIKVIK